jgi:hypothetical protein
VTIELLGAQKPPKVPLRAGRLIAHPASKVALIAVTVHGEQFIKILFRRLFRFPPLEGEG